MTFSVLGFDETTFALGVAVASRALAVGSRVPHLRGGVGVVVVQAFAPLEWGPLAMARLARGAFPTGVIDDLRSASGAASAQVAMMDRSGRVAGFTGAACEPEAGIAFGAACCGAANLMERPGVPEAVVSAFEQTAGRPLAQRLLLALAAGEALGGDIRGRQSAYVSVATPRADRRADVDLRVDDSRSPVPELSRLLTLHQADSLVTSAADPDGHYRDVEPLLEAVKLAPDDLGCLSALGRALLRAGRVAEAMPHLTRLARLEPRTPVRLQRLIDTGHLDRRVGRAALQRLNPGQTGTAGA